MKLSFTDLRCLSLDEKLEILKWRNSDRVRLNMVNQHIISEDEHLKFCERICALSNDFMYRVSIDDLNCGVVHYTDLDYDRKGGEYSLYVFDERPAIGVFLGQSAINFFFINFGMSELRMYVLESNRRALSYNEALLHFKEKTYKPNEFVINGSYTGCYHYIMTREYWNSIQSKYYNKNLKKIDFRLNDRPFRISI